MRILDAPRFPPSSSRIVVVGLTMAIILGGLGALANDRGEDSGSRPVDSSVPPPERSLVSAQLAPVPWSTPSTPPSGMVRSSAGANASLVPEIGRAIGGIANGSGDYLAGAYDSGDGRTYFVRADNGNIQHPTLVAVQGNRVVGTERLAFAALSIAYDPIDQDLYVPYYFSASGGPGDGVAILHGLTYVQNLTNATAFSGPNYAVFDPVHGWVYISNYLTPRIVVLNGTSILASVLTSSATLALGFDGADGWVVAATSINTIALINGTHLVRELANIVNFGGTWPNAFYAGILFDPQAKVLLIASFNSSASSYLTVLNATDAVRGVVIERLTLPAFHYFAFDSSNGLVYVAPDQKGAVLAVNLTTRNSTPISIGCYGCGTASLGPLTYDPSNGVVYVANFGALALNITPISTQLAVGPPTAGAHGEGEAGAGLTLQFEMFGVGDGNATANVTASPTGGLDCPGAPWAVPVGNLSPEVVIACRGVSAGVLAVRVAVTDGLNHSVFASTNLSIVPSVTIATPTASRTSIDFGQGLTLRSMANQGTAPYEYRWLGLPPGCGTSTDTASIACVPAQLGRFNISVAATDFLNGSAQSPTIGLLVQPEPEIALELPSSRDVGQELVITAYPSSGSGGNAYTWSGLPPGCPQPAANASMVECPKLLHVGTFEPTVSVRDATGGTSGPVRAPVTVVAAPISPILTISAEVVDLGQSVEIVAYPSEGPGDLAYRWSGLPPGLSTGNGTASGAPTELGEYTIGLTISDPNGVSVSSPPLNVSVNDRPSVALNGSEVQVPVGRSVHFAALGRGGTAPLAYIWLFGDGGAAGGPWAQHAFRRPGAYEVRLFVQDSAGSSVNGSWNVTVVQGPPAPASPSTWLGVDPAVADEILAAVVADLGAGLALVEALRRGRRATPASRATVRARSRVPPAPAPRGTAAGPVRRSR